MSVLSGDCLELTSIFQIKSSYFAYIWNVFEDTSWSRNSCVCRSWEDCLYPRLCFLLFVCDRVKGHVTLSQQPMYSKCAFIYLQQTNDQGVYFPSKVQMRCTIEVKGTKPNLSTYDLTPPPSQ